MSTLTFEQWMVAVDKAVQKTVGLSVYDLADTDFYGQYDAGTKPAAAAKELLAEEGWTE